MNKHLTTQEAEAVLILKGSNELAFNTLISYFERRYNMARDKCVVTKAEDVGREQGKATAFEEIMNIEQSADNVQKEEKQK